MDHGQQTDKMDQAKQTGMDGDEQTEEKGEDLDSVPQLVEPGTLDGNESEGDDKDWDEATGQKVIPEKTNRFCSKGR